MEQMIDLAGVAAAIAASMVLALGLEWLSLRGLMRLMPARPRALTETPRAAGPAAGRPQSDAKAA
ncbi:MAG TPA: hypothetical protein VLY23_17500 [Candidatus Acidoferrum sp.]|nr:hypothetical protein [Candidatus Acidoferrum sp.]